MFMNVCIHDFDDAKEESNKVVEASCIASWWWIKIDSRCFDDNKDDDKKPKRMISRLSQEQFKNQEKFDFKIQVSRIKNQE